MSKELPDRILAKQQLSTDEDINSSVSHMVRSKEFLDFFGRLLSDSNFLLALLSRYYLCYRELIYLMLNLKDYICTRWF
jgi:hypothetical protein